MINLYLGAVVMTVPFFTMAAPRTAANVSQEWLFALLAVFGAIMLGLKRPRPQILAATLLFFACAFRARDPFGPHEYFQLGMTFSGLLFVALVYSHREEINLKRLGHFLGLACLIEAAWICLNVLQIDPFMEYFKLRGLLASVPPVTVTGSLGNINHSGAFVAATIPFLPVWLWPLPLASLYLQGGSLPVACAAVSVIAFRSYQKRSYAPALAGAVALLLAGLALIFKIIPQGSYFSDGTRTEAWGLFVKQTGFSWTGHGLGHISSMFSKTLIKNERFFQLHNEWLELYAIGGLLCAVVGVYLILPVFKNKGNPAINACLMSLLVNSLGNFTFHIAPLFMVFGTCYALQIGKE